MRRSTRIRWQIPIQITSVDPNCSFDEKCETVAVNAHGCGVICHIPLEKGTPVKLGLLPENQEVMAHVADVVKLGEDGRAWLLGLQLDAPANVWGVRNPPHDWEKPIAGQENEPAEAPLAASAAAGAAGSGFATATLAAPEFAVASPAPPAGVPVALQSAAVAEPPKIDSGKPAARASNNGHAGNTPASRASGTQPGSSVVYNVRDRDWAELRRQLEEHLQDLMWQVDDQVETKLEHWKEQMVDAEARLESLCQLQDRLQAHLTVLSEIVKERVKPEEEGGEKAPPAATEAKSGEPSETGAESGAVTASQVEEIRQLQQWMQSLIHLLPQAVEQHANEAVGAAEQRLLTHAEEQLEGLRKQLADLQQRQDSAAQTPAGEADAEQAERERSSQEALQAASQEIKESLQKSLREDIEQFQQEFKQAQQAAQDEAERLRRLQEEAAQAAAEKAAQAAQKDEHLAAAEAAVCEMAEQLRAEIRAQLEADRQAQKQQMEQATADMQEKSSALQSKLAEVSTQIEEARRARESLESVVASLTQAASQQIKEDVAAGLQKLGNQAQQESEGREKALEEKLLEAERQATTTAEQLTALTRQAEELSARLREDERNRESLQARLDSVLAAAEQKMESSAAGILQRVSSQSDEHIRHVEGQVAAHQKQLEELSRQRQQQLRSELDAHMAELRKSSEQTLRGISEELRGSLNIHLKEEFASQRALWEKQREASQAEKTWVESRANELAGRWEARLQGYIERATGEAVGKLRADVEKAAAEIIREQMEAVEKRLSVSLQPLLSRAEDSSRALETLLGSVRQERHQAEAQTAALQRQKDEAQGWMEKQMERLRQAVHDAVVETSGEIKGRIHMAVEMAREPIEQRSREAQRQMEELAERKSREICERLAEFEKAVAPRLQANLAQVSENFRKETDELARNSVHRCQDELADTLDAMLHTVRAKRETST